MPSLQTFLLFLPLLALVVVANLGERRPWARYATYFSLLLINLGLLGIAALALLNEVAQKLMPSLPQAQGLTVSWLAVGAICLATAVLGFLPLIPAVRRWLARWLHIDPGSVVHTTALAFAIYEIGLSLAQLALIGNLENLATSGVSLTVWDVLLNELPLLLLAALGVGLFIRRNGGQALERLGLCLPSWRQLILTIAVTILLLAFDLGVNEAWRRLDPSGYSTLQQVSDQIFGGLMSVGGALALGLSAGIAEEMLFRGAILPRLGLLLTSGLFAIGHLQYGLTVATLEVFAIGLVLGLVRNRTNTTTTILIHASYNAAGVLLGLLKP